MLFPKRLIEELLQKTSSNSCINSQINDEVVQSLYLSKWVGAQLIIKLTRTKESWENVGRGKKVKYLFSIMRLHCR